MQRKSCDLGNADSRPYPYSPAHFSPQSLSCQEVSFLQTQWGLRISPAAPNLTRPWTSRVRVSPGLESSWRSRGETESKGMGGKRRGVWSLQREGESPSVEGRAATPGLQPVFGKPALQVGGTTLHVGPLMEGD